jgi:hypothetical protein
MSFGYSPLQLLAFLNVVASSIVVILAFALLAYTFTYNFRSVVAQTYALLLACVMIAYASEVALARVGNAESASRWLRFEWLGIALLPSAYYLFSLAILRTTNYRLRRRRWLAALMLTLSGLSALDALFGSQIVDRVQFSPTVSYLDAGPFFAPFTLFFVVAVTISFYNVWKARQRCLTEHSRMRINYLLLGFAAPGVGIFPYLIALSRLSDNGQANVLLFLVSIVGHLAIAAMLVIMGYVVAYYGVLAPDRVVRYRMLRFFMRGPVVAILVILAIQTLPTIERIMGLPRDIVVFTVITGVIVWSQLFLSMSKSLVDRLIYREDREEIAWLNELDRRLLTSSDLHQFLENYLAALCELLRSPAGFVAAVVGPDLILEATIGPTETRLRIAQAQDWSDALSRALKEQTQKEHYSPIQHQRFWLWPLVSDPALTNNHTEPEMRILGMLGVQANTDKLTLTAEEEAALAAVLGRMSEALADRRLQQNVFHALRQLIPNIERIQQLRGVVPYIAQESETTPSAIVLDPSPVHSPEFEVWVKEALNHYWGGPKLTRSPLHRLRLVNDAMQRADDDPTKALRLVLGTALERLKPDGKPNLSAPEWLLYNILDMRFIQGRKVREIADRLAMSESDLYRKQRVAIGQLARMLSEMEQEEAAEKVQGIEKEGVKVTEQRNNSQQSDAYEN